jgi:hypothetical protein
VHFSDLLLLWIKAKLMKALAIISAWIPGRNSILFLLHFPLALLAQFTPGRLVVLQAGDGSLPLSSNGNAILFKEYSTNGTPGFSLSVPSTGTNAILIRGSANSEGHLSLSEDANCIVFGAYLQSLPYASPLNSPAASSLNRGIGLVLWHKQPSGKRSKFQKQSSFHTGI